MTEQEWLAWGDPSPMMDMVGGKPCFRKYWLFTAASCTRASPFLDPELTQRIATISERYADAKASVAERRTLRNVAREWKEKFVIEHDFFAAAYLRDFEYFLESPAKSDFFSASWVIRLPDYAGWDTLRPQRWSAARIEYHYYQCQLMRDLFGNPFRRVAINPRTLAWNDGIAIKLAQTIYDDRAFDHLPILADAVEEAGCTDADILNHCRQPGEHVRGCWVVDLILGKN